MTQQKSNENHIYYLINMPSVLVEMKSIYIAFWGGLSSTENNRNEFCTCNFASFVSFECANQSGRVHVLHISLLVVTALQLFVHGLTQKLNGNNNHE